MRCILVLGLLSVLATGMQPVAAAGDTIFRGGIAGAAEPSPLPLWTALVQRARQDGDDQPLKAAPRQSLSLPPISELAPADCNNACARAQWTAFLQSIRNEPRIQQLNAVNRWVNAKPYIEDWKNWGVPDYWETPPEFMRRGGDCEDYAIAKYFSLIRLGVAPADLRIVVVEDRNLKASHAVVAVRYAGQTWLLDIAVPAVVPMNVARQYAPVYAFNSNGWWLYPPMRDASTKPTDLISPARRVPSR